MEKAKDWLYSKGRDLEITIYNALFTDMGSEDVFTSLTLYLSEDGGFGNQLAYNAVGSSIYETFLAMRILTNVSYQSSDAYEELEQTFDYLFKNDVYHSPYFAGLMAAGLVYLDQDESNYKKCQRYIKELLLVKEITSKEMLESYILLYDLLYQTYDLANLREMLSQTIIDYILTEDLKPFDLINNDHLVNEKLEPYVLKNLEEILKTRLSTGAWLKEDIDDIETIKKSGILTMNNMLILKNFNRI